MKERTTRREMLKLMGIGAVGTFLAACTPVAPASEEAGAQAEAASVQIEYWSTWWQSAHDEIQTYVEEFQAQNPSIIVDTSHIPGGAGTGEGVTRLLAAIAAQTPPSLSVIDGFQTSQWAGQGALFPMTEYAQRDDVWGEDKFIPGAWRESFFGEELWSLPHATDVNAALFWNKDMFEAAGLDPEKPPTTIAELDEYAELLTISEDGTYTQMGFIPWIGSGDAPYAWMIPFGGRLYDPATGLVTANEAENVASLEWVVSYADKYGREQVQEFESGIVMQGSNPLNAFYQGELAMKLLGNWHIPNFRDYAPQLNYGVAGTPYPSEGGIAEITYLGGYSFILPKGSEYPEDAWQLAKYINAPEQQTRFAEANGTFSTRRESEMPTVFAESGYLDVLTRILVNSTERPVINQGGLYWDEMETGLQFVVRGEKTAQQMLDDVTEKVNAEIEKAMM